MKKKIFIIRKISSSKNLISRKFVDYFLNLKFGFYTKNPITSALTIKVSKLGIIETNEGKLKLHVTKSSIQSHRTKH